MNAGGRTTEIQLLATQACFKWAGKCVTKVCSSSLSLSCWRGRRLLIAHLQQA